LQGEGLRGSPGSSTGPHTGKTQDAATDVKNIRVGERTPGLDQLHGRFGFVALGDQNGRPHGDAAMTASCAMGVDLPAGADRLQRSLDAAH